MSHSILVIPKTHGQPIQKHLTNYIWPTSYPKPIKPTSWTIFLTTPNADSSSSPSSSFSRRNFWCFQHFSFLFNYGISNHYFLIKTSIYSFNRHTCYFIDFLHLGDVYKFLLSVSSPHKTSRNLQNLRNQSKLICQWRPNLPSLNWNFVSV